MEQVNHGKAERKKSKVVDGRNVPEAYLRRIALSPNEPAFWLKKDGKYQPLVWKEVHAWMLGIYEGLSRMGIGKGDAVCIMSGSRPEWLLTDIAVQGLKGIAVPIYHSSSLEDIAYILDHCQAKAVFAEDAAQCEKLAQVFKKRPALPVIMFQGESHPGLKVTPMKEFAKLENEKAAHEAFAKTAATIQPNDMASIVYTSGTTGLPKGAVLTHHNFGSELRFVVNEIELYESDVTLTFLPFAHIFGRVESFLPIFAGTSLGFAESINSVSQNISELKPTLLLSVPRIYEKIYAKIISQVESAPPARKKIFYWAVGVGRAMAVHRSLKTTPSPLLWAKFKLADKLVFEKIRNTLGGNIRLTVSGGAPLNRELCEFFHACGIKVLEGYGLTETTAAVAVNRPDDYRFGTVGRPVGDSQFKIAEDGEILVKGSLIFREYYRNDEASGESLKNGWFHTGDIGEIDAHGFLRITDRKKELIVTAGGKKVAPQKLENMIKARRFMSNGLVFGDKQKYLVALVTLNEPEVTKWASESGIAFSDYAELSKQPKVKEIVETEIAEVNKELASYESIKKFRILPKDFTIESGELTPSLKLKRKVCVERYRSEIDGMYA